MYYNGQRILFQAFHFRYTERSESMRLVQSTKKRRHLSVMSLALVHFVLLSGFSHHDDGLRGRDMRTFTPNQGFVPGCGVGWDARRSTPNKTAMMDGVVQQIVFFQGTQNTLQVRQSSSRQRMCRTPSYYQFANGLVDASPYLGFSTDSFFSHGFKQHLVIPHSIHAPPGRTEFV